LGKYYKYSMSKKNKSIIPTERIASSIYVLRNKKVILDYDLAELYGVPTKALNQAVSRNVDRFPEDFMFRISRYETEAVNQSQTVTGSQKHRDPRYAPRAFTQEGIAMLSSVLRSKQAIEINIAIMRTFVRMRQLLATNEELARKVKERDHLITNLYKHVEKLMAPSTSNKNPIGYIWTED